MCKKSWTETAADNSDDWDGGLPRQQFDMLYFTVIMRKVGEPG